MNYKDAIDDKRCLKKLSGQRPIIRSLRARGITCETLGSLLDHVAQTRNITALDLSDNFICAEGCHILSRLLHAFPTLQDLSLRNNVISDRGVALLCEALRGHPTLKTLSLKRNAIGDAGAFALVQLLGSSSRLEELDLSYNDIGDLGAIALSCALDTNANIVKLNMAGIKTTSFFNNFLLEKQKHFPFIKRIQLSDIGLSR